MTNTFLDSFAWSTWGATLVALALPLAGLGVYLRRGARRRREWLGRLADGRRSLRDLGPGAVTVEGVWRRIDADGFRGVLEAGGGEPWRAVIECQWDPGFADGARVVVSGFATHQIANPLGTGYRDDARVWVIEAQGKDQLCSARPDALEHGVRMARLWGHVGAALFAAGIAISLSGLLVAWRAGQEGYGDETSWRGSHEVPMGVMAPITTPAAGDEEDQVATDDDADSEGDEEIASDQDGE